MAKITFDGAKRNWMQWFMITLVAGKKDAIDSFIRNEEGTLTGEISIVLNGHDVSEEFKGCIERLEGEFDRNVAKSAAELMREKLSDIFEGMEDIQKEAEKKMGKLLGLRKDEDGYWELIND